MKILLFLKKEKYIFLILLFLSIIALVPYIIASFYIHPNADDFTFSKEINDLGTFGFIKHYYQTWSGRFFAFLLLGSTKAHIIQSSYWYTLTPNLFILLTGVSIYSILHLFLKNVISNWKIGIFSLLFLSFYITGLHEMFSAIYWNCSSYYLIANVFFIWFIYEFLIFQIQKNSIKSFNFLKLGILSFLVCGLTEVYIISLIVVFGIIIFHTIINQKKINYPLLILMLIIFIGGYLNIFSSGSLNRMEISKSDGGLPFIYSAYRAFYNLIILQLAPLLYSGFLFILILVLIYGHHIIKNNPKLESFFKINPLFTFTSVIFIFYLHHAMSLYGAGYVLQGRVLNITNLLLYLSLMFVIMNIVAYYKVNQINASKSIGLISLVILAFIINFSSNSRIVGKEIVTDFPTFNREMNSRYKQIISAKSEGKTAITIERISVDLRTLYFGYEYIPNQSYYNSKKICRDLTAFFDINVTIKKDNYDKYE